MTIPTIDNIRSNKLGYLNESTRKRLSLISFAVWGFTILFVRAGESLDRIPSDPGDDYFRAAALEPIKSLFLKADNQLIVGIRLLSEIVILFPFRYQAIVTNILVIGIWVLTSLLIVYIIQLESSNKLISYIGGTLFLVAPAMSESQLGNIGGTRWALYGAVAFAISSPKFRSNHFLVLIGLIILLGITHPLALVLLPGALHWLFFASKAERQKIRIIFSVFVVCFIIQLIASGIFNGSQIGRLNTAVFWPWQGAGAFWWFNWLFPPLLACSILCLRLLIGSRYSLKNTFATLLALQSLSISIATYALAGIGDRYMIIPFALSGTSAFIMLFDLRSKLRRFFIPILVLTIFLALVPIVKWFPASWYLTDQPNWRLQIDTATTRCKINGSGEVLLFFSPDRAEPYSCQEILSRNS